MVARLTPAEARKLGIQDSGIVSRKRTTRTVAKGVPYHSRCTRCGDEFHSEAAEERHLRSHHHARYEIVDGGIHD